MTTTNSLVQTLLDGHTTADQEHEVLAVIEAMPGAELNELLDDETAERLMDSMDNRLFGPDNHARLVQVLERRRPELDLYALAAIVRALQSGRTGTQDEHRIADIICQLQGFDLTKFKNIVSLRKDQHDLEGLVYIAIDDKDVRQRILDHIAEQAASVPRTEAKVMSDIDDTIFCKLHDKRYPKGVVYPGALAFQEALDLGPGDQPISMGDITFVTARPGDVFGLIAQHSRESLTKAGIADLTMLSGSLFSLRSLDAMAGKKVANIEHYVELFPEYRMVFMGDSGQGDVKVGEQIWERFGDVVQGVFIHDVVDTPDDKRAEWAAKRIWFHDTYVGAAAKALELGLISAKGLRTVIDEATQELGQIEFEDDEQRRRMQDLFARDTAMAEQSLATRLPR